MMVACPLGTNYDQQDCTLARALEILGERWTMLVLRDCFYGVRRFTHLLEHLDVSRAVLTDRLTGLVEAGVLERRTEDEPSRLRADRGRCRDRAGTTRPVPRLPRRRAPQEAATVGVDLPEHGHLAHRGDSTDWRADPTIPSGQAYLNGRLRATALSVLQSDLTGDDGPPHLTP